MVLCRVNAKQEKGVSENKGDKTWRSMEPTSSAQRSSFSSLSDNYHSLWLEGRRLGIQYTVLLLGFKIFHREKNKTQQLCWVW